MNATSRGCTPACGLTAPSGLCSHVNVFSVDFLIAKCELPFLIAERKPPFLIAERESLYLIAERESLYLIAEREPLVILNAVCLQKQSVFLLERPLLVVF